jgi:oxygen-independent coproporphyrinogen III oxidase
MVSLYVHIPFCQSRCHYCDFATWAGLGALIEPYGQALVHELGALLPWLEKTRVETLYLGGGTPSLLPTNLLAQIVSVVPLDPQAEVTIEANPGTVSAGALAEMRQAGFNRLSLGMQSARTEELVLLGRTHRLDDLIQAVEWARAAGFENINLDLLYGMPGQTVAHWIDSIRAGLSLEPEHLSLYALTVEPGTVLDRWTSDGRLPAIDPDLAAVMYELAQTALAPAGYLHYEISNWSLPGYSARHNLVYWSNRSYLGVGASAWGHCVVSDTSWRLRNMSHPEDYIERIGRQCSLLTEHLPISPACVEQEFIPRPWAMAETMVLGLRLVQQGVSRAGFRDRFGVDPVEHYRTRLTELETRGWIGWDDKAILLQPAALLISNEVLIAFLPPTGYS